MKFHLNKKGLRLKLALSMMWDAMAMVDECSEDTEVVVLPADDEFDDAFGEANRYQSLFEFATKEGNGRIIDTESESFQEWLDESYFDEEELLRYLNSPFFDRKD